jgi:serine/threonine-protein kinase PpkA
MDQSLSTKIRIPGYELKSVLGHGGMSTVFLAVQESLGREVALKVMNPTLVEDSEFQQRFLNEGRIVARLRHPNIVVVHDIGIQGECYYLAMSYLPCGTLKERVGLGMSLAEKLAIIRQIAGALGYAHDRGIVHRDIKPQNVLFDEANSPVLSDFGIAKSIGASTNLTTTGMTFGSIPYMSPEQTRSAGVDHRSDLYSFGVVFWELLTGALPYTAETQFALAFKHATQPIPDLPPSLEAFQPILSRLLAKAPADRFSSVHEMNDALDAVSTGVATKPPPLPADLERTVLDLKPWKGEVVAADRTLPQTDVIRERKTRLSMVIATVLAVAVVSVAAYFVFRPIGPGSLGPPQIAGHSTESEGSPVEVQSPGEAVREGGPMAATTDTSTAGEPAGNAGEDRLAELEDRAARQWSAGKYTEPPGDNAFETYRAILRLDQGNLGARDKLLAIGRIQLGRQALQAAEGLSRDGKLREALDKTEMGLRLVPDDPQLLAMRDRLKKEQSARGK